MCDLKTSNVYSSSPTQIFNIIFQIYFPPLSFFFKKRILIVWEEVEGGERQNSTLIQTQLFLSQQPVGYTWHASVCLKDELVEDPKNTS